MSEHEKMILIKLLNQEYNQGTLNYEEYNTILNKIIKANFIIENLTLNCCKIENRGGTLNVDFDLIERLHIVDSKIDVTKEGIIISSNNKGLHRDVTIGI